MKDLGVTEENDEKIIKFYVDRLKTKITKKQFENYIDKLKVEEKENEKEKEIIDRTANNYVKYKENYKNTENFRKLSGLPG